MKAVCLELKRKQLFEAKKAEKLAAKRAEKLAERLQAKEDKKKVF